MNEPASGSSRGGLRPVSPRHVEGRLPRGRLTHFPYATGQTREDLARGVRTRSDALWRKWERLRPVVLDTEVEVTVQLDNVTIVEGRADALMVLPGAPTAWNVDLKTAALPAKDARIENPDLEWDVLTQLDLPPRPRGGRRPALRRRARR